MVLAAYDASTIPQNYIYKNAIFCKNANVSGHPFDDTREYVRACYQGMGVWMYLK